MASAEEIRELLEPILESYGLTLWDLQFRKQGPKWLLRVYIDRKDGVVTLNDCEAVSKDLGAVLDVEDSIEHAYTLEVSSPGLDRVLTKLEHYVRFTGSLIKLKTYEPVNGEKVFRGRLSDATDDRVTIQLGDGSLLEVPFNVIAKASLEPEI